MKKLFYLLRAAFGLVSLLQGVGCQTPPATKVTETHQIHWQELSASLNAPVELSEEMILIDSRSHFDYSMAHLRNSFHLDVGEVVAMEKLSGEKLSQARKSWVRRLALMGIGPQSSVLILGAGGKGNGDEWRLAWELSYLGLNKIQVADIQNFARLFTNAESRPRPNVPFWSPVIREVIRADKEEIQKAISSQSKRGSLSEQVHILDVRSQSEYFQKDQKSPQKYRYPDLGATHIEWKEFFLSDGRPRIDMKNQLQAINIHLNDRIIVVSNQGKRSSAVTLALLSMGFHKVANYLGGYQDWATGR